MDQPINLREKLTRVSEYWTPRIVGNLNNLDLLLVRVKDEFVWHSHPDTDDFFFVIDGRLDIEVSLRSKPAMSSSFHAGSSTNPSLGTVKHSCWSSNHPERRIPATRRPPQ